MNAQAMRQALYSCKNEKERRKVLPQLCRMADELEQMPDPKQQAELLYIILYRREQEATHGKQKGRF